MNNILFTDTHFGVKQNSITWFNSQKKFIKEQLLPYIKQYGKDCRLIHLGDVFDSRSSISTYIAHQVVELFRELAANVREFYIICGNHDYYSPNTDEYNTVDLILGNIPNITIVSKSIKLIDDFALVPWFQWENRSDNESQIQQALNKHDIKYIFTHGDIIHEDTYVKDIKVFSGHVHIPYIKNNLYNLGSCFSLDFGDSNAPRGFYDLFEDGRLKFIENKSSIRFYRLYNDDIFNIPQISNTDYVEIYMKQENLSNEKYLEVIRRLTNEIKNISIIPQLAQLDMETIKFDGYNMDNIINEMVPEHLKEKLKYIKSRMDN